ncbi:MarR family transcriptional regulator [Streptomyces sp. H34-S4]|uniref:MarR family transcriptional regulator n=1 Tax=Streptomyces sp. H34-S4 TaxID=2996463 RepID=UPI0022720A47|nr:helix-turn-helix domain-containing protein [Streptomyces sp. H34-S4]MCY0938429.1 helix-turn-helix domain-containing protein [Streptomyces sp. H34-S4]
MPVSDTGEEFRETLTEKFADLIAKTPKRGRPVQQVDVSVRVTQRAPHEMYGTAGFSAVSNEFLSDVLAVLIAQHGMSPIQSAVLVWCIGKQKEGWVKATHKLIAERLGVERANVSRAVSRLEEWHMIQKVRPGVLFVNPLIGFMGNGDRQQEILAKLRQGTPQDAFPKLNAPPAPRSAQLELGQDQEEAAC